MIENMTKKVSVVVPVYFNAPSLPELFNRLDNLNRELLGINLELEVVAIDDGSKDDTLAVLIKKFGLKQTDRFYESQLPHREIKAWNRPA